MEKKQIINNLKKLWIRNKNEHKNENRYKKNAVKWIYHDHDSYIL